jgi:hypothetical protein
VTELTIVCALLIVLAAFHLWDRRGERRQLIDALDRMAARIQAPQAAAVEFANVDEGPEYAPPAIDPDDDDAFWESRDRLAERLMAEEQAGGD